MQKEKCKNVLRFCIFPFAFCITLNVMSPEIRPARVRLVLVALLVAAGVGAAVYLIWSRTDRPESPPNPAHDDGPPDPRLTFETPFRNVRPDVAYVGDAACAPCHRELNDSYHRHPMGRSAAAATDPADGVGSFDPAKPPRFTVFGHVDFLVERRGNQLVHTEVIKDASGSEALRTEAAVVVSIGSGTRGRSYLCARDGSLWQSSISWFTEKQMWDASPGFGPGRHGVRHVAAACLYCHVDRVEPVKGTLNRFREPFFARQAAIGCERCHGPGSLHVAEQTDGKGPVNGIDTSIVNPKHLPADLREDVCRQCHFQGAQRLERRGREPFDYRPGLPLDLFLTVFVRHPAITDYHKSVGQVEQTAISQCATVSGGRFGCTSCHDPHRKPEPAVEDDFYRQRCLTCHKQDDCRELPDLRRAKKDACTACHMPKAASTSIAHTAVTDHRILRRPLPATDTPKVLPAGEMPIQTLAGYGRHGPDQAERERDLGIALANIARDPRGDSTTGSEAIKLLRNATARHPNDAVAWETLAAVLIAQGEWSAALRAAESAVAVAPERETALATAAEAATSDSPARTRGRLRASNNPRESR